MINNLWKPYIQPSAEIKKNTPARFLDEIKEQYKEWCKSPENFIEKISQSSSAKVPEEHFHLSLPRRKRYFGLVPIGLEIGLFNTPLEIHEQIIKNIALTDKALSNISHDIAHLPDATHFLETVYKHSPLSGSNLGIYAHAFFHTRFEMMNAPIFSIDDNLYRELCETDISNKTPCEFFRAPMPMMYLEFGQKRDIDLPRAFNRETQWHCLEGAYLSTYTLTDEELTREANDKEIALGDLSIPRNSHNIISHALVTGHINVGDGDVQIIEVLSTGSPVGKAHLMDDATSQFALVVQDRDMSVDEMLDWHIKFNRRELPTQREQQNSGVSDYLPLKHVHRINDEEVESISNAVHAITKALLYINSETCNLTNHFDATEHKKSLLRTKNKAKIRKLKNKGKALSDYILVTLPKEEQSEASPSGSTGSGKSTHWRRAHFHTFRYGEGRKKTRVKWIGRKHVNATKGLAKPKNYIVK
jgi:hypothetical protein